MDGAGASLSGGIETGNNLVIAVLIDCEALTPVVAGDAAHVVVDSGDDGDGLPGHIDTSKDHRGLRDAGKSGGQLLWGQVVQLQVNVILLRSTASTLSDLNGHGPTDNVSGGQVLGDRGVSLHEPLALTVDEVTSLASAALSHEAASAVDTGWVELDKLHVLVGEPGPADHGGAVTSAGVGRGGGEVRLARTASGHDRVLGAEPVDGAVLETESDHSATLTVLHQKVQGKVLDKVVAVVSEKG